MLPGDQLLGDLLGSDEHAAAMLAYKQAGGHQFVGCRPQGGPGNAELGAECALRRDGVAGSAGLDQLQNVVAHPLPLEQSLRRLVVHVSPFLVCLKVNQLGATSCNRPTGQSALESGTRSGWLHDPVIGLQQWPLHGYLTTSVVYANFIHHR